MQIHGPLIDNAGLFHEILAELCDIGLGEADLQWSENTGPPETSDIFALESAFVICNSGMHNRVAAAIFARIRRALLNGESATTVFGHAGKAAAIDRIWASRHELHVAYLEAIDKIAFCRSLPWIGGITSYHLAKNFGAPVAKPDIHLQRLAARHGTDPQTLCESLAERLGFSVGAIDVILWRACAERILDARTSLLRCQTQTAAPRPALPFQVELFQPVQQEMFPGPN